MSVLIDLRDRLIAGGYEGDIALARLPDSPDAILALRQYPGDPSRDFDARMLPAHERPAVQMVTRVGKDDGEAAAMLLARQAYRILAGRYVTINGNRYDWIRAAQIPTPYGRDVNDRPLIVVNLSMQRWGDLSILPPPDPNGDNGDD